MAGFNLTAEINLRGPTNVRQVVGQIRRQLTGINANVNVALNPRAVRQVSDLNRNFQQLNRTLQQTRNIASSISTSLSQLGTSAGQLSNNLRSIPQNLQRVSQAATTTAQSARQTAQATQVMTSEFEEFGRQSALAVRRFAAFATVTGVIYRASNAISSASKDFLDFEKELIKVAQVSRTSVGGLSFLVNNITSLSTGLGVASKDLIQVSRTLTQAGLSANDTSRALEALAKSALAPTFDNLNNTVEGSVALMKQFGIGAGQLESALGSINAVAGKFAVEAGDIITAISRTGGVFANASKGVSAGTDALNEFIAVFTSVRATTRESAETIATGLRTIFTRIQRADTIEALKEYGVTLTDLTGKFVGPYEATRRLAEGLSQLDPRDISFSRIVEELGGFRQVGKVIPLIQQFATAQRALNVAQAGSGSLSRDAATAQLGLANQIAKVREEFSALIRSIGQSSGFQDLARIALDLTSGLVQLADAAKGALPALTAIFAIRGFKALGQFGRGFAGGISRSGTNTLNSGGYVRAFAKGGLVPGSGNRDTVPARLTPGEFVIRKKAVETIGTRNLHRMNKYGSGGKVQNFAGGGIVQDMLNSPKFAIGAAVLEKAKGQQTTSKTLKRVTEKELRSTLPALKEGESIPAGLLKGVDLVKSQLSQQTYEKFDNALESGIGVGANAAARILSQSIDPTSKVTKVSKATLKNFITGINEASKGNLFEDVLYVLSQKSSTFSPRGSPQDPFDFPAGLGSTLIDDFSGLPSKWVDAKASSAKAEPGRMRPKLINQILNELKANPALLSSAAVQQDDEPDLPERAQTKTKRALGGFIRHFAKGGNVQDTVPAMLTPGEFVINKKAASRIGSARLHSLNRADRVKGYNKGGAVGRVQRFANGGDVFDFATSFDPVSDAAQKALEASISKAVVNAAKDIRARSPGGSMTSQEAITAARQQTDVTVNRGLLRAADTGDQKAAKMVADAQRKQTNSIIKQIRAQDQNVTVMQAKAAAEKRVGQAWGGLVKKVQQGQQTQQRVNQSGQQLNQAQNRNAQANNQAAQTTAAPAADQAGGRKGMDFGNLGTALAFAGPMLAQQIGDTIGGTTGAGVAGAATGFSTAVGIGSQFGPYGALVGAIAGTVMAVDGYNSAVAKKEAEMAGIEIDKTLETSTKAREEFAKTGSDASANKLVANFQKIQALEEKRSEANIRAEQPGYLSSLINTVSFGALGGDSRTAAEKAGVRTSEQQNGAEEAQALIDSMIQQGKTYTEVTALLQKQGGAISNLYSAMAEANPEYQDAVQEIQASNMAEELKVKSIERLRKKYADQNKAATEAQFADAARAKASASLTKTINVVAASMTRTFDNMDQAIGAASTNIKKAGEQIKKIAAGGTGFTAQLQSLDVLANPRAFNRSQQNDAIRQGAQFAGSDRSFVEQMSRFSLDVQDTIASVAANAQTSGITDPGVVADKTIDAVTQQLEDQFGRSNLTEQIRDSLREAIQKDPNLDIQKLLEEKIPQFNIGKRALDSTVKALKFLQDALNFASVASQEYGKLQGQLLNNQAAYQNTILQSDLSLKQALGQRVTVQDKIGARQSAAAAKTGVAPTDFNLTALSQRQTDLTKQRDQLVRALETSANAIDTNLPGAAQQFAGLTRQLAVTESALKATEDSLKNMPQVIEGNINDIIGEIGRIQQAESQRQQQAAGFAERLVGSTPQELQDLRSTFGLLNNTLNGQITTIQQSQAAQQAYQAALNNGQTQQEAMAAAQQAFSAQTKGALSLFNELSQMSGLSGKEIMSMRADLLKNFAKGQGLDVENDPLFQKLISMMQKDPGDSPEIQALRGVLEQQKATLKETYQALNQSIIEQQKNVLTTANQAFIQELQNVKLNFNTEQLRGFGLGIGRPGQATNARPLADGGVVYASTGKYVDYQPRGTDTVPAMLTPGEFVVNAKATKNNLGLLRSINSSAGGGKTFSKGGVVYAAGGGFMDILARIYRNLDPRLLLEEDRSALENFGTVSGLGLIGTGAVAARSSGFRGFLRNAMSGSLGRLSNFGSGIGRLLGRIPGVGSLGRLGSGMGNFSIGNLFSADLTSGGQSFRDIFSMGNQGSSLGRMPRASSLGARSLLSRGLGTVGLAANAYGGFTADTNQTNRNRYLNTVLAIGSGSGTTMGDVGAQSFLGSQLGVEQGGYADRQLGNWSQFGLQTAALTSMGVDPATAGLITAGSMVTQEGVGLYGDRQELADTRDRTRRMQDAGRTSTDQIVGDRERMIIQRAGGLNTYEGRSSAEVSFIKEQAKLLKEIRDLESKYDPTGPAGDLRNAELGQRLAALREEKERKFNEQKAKSLTRNENENFVRTGTLWNTSTFDEASINRDIQREAGFQSRRATAEADIAREEKQKKQEEAQRIAREQNQAEAEENEYQRQLIEEEKQKRAEQKAIQVRRQKAVTMGLAANATDEDITQRQAVINADWKNYKKYQQQDIAAQQAINKPLLPPNHEIYDDKYKDAIEQRQFLNSSIAEARGAIFDPNALPPFIRDNPAALADYQRKWRLEQEDRIRQLYADLDAANQTIVEKEQSTKNPNIDADQEWEQYKSGQEKEKRKQAKTERKQAMDAAREYGRQIRAAASYGNIPVPNKFQNPGAFFAWKKRLGAKLSKDFGFGQRTPEALKALGMDANVVDNLFKPFSDEQAEAIYGAMLNSSGLTGSSRTVVAALQKAKRNAVQGIEKDPNLQRIISSASAEDRALIQRKFQSTFGKQVRQLNSYSRAVDKFDKLNPGQQAMARANMIEKLTRDGVIDMRAPASQNIDRLNAMQGSNVAQFLFPNKQTANRALRVGERPAGRSRGGIIYASTGMLVPYEPRGTDTVPAMLTPGEFVVNRAATQRHRPLLESINRSKGGSVTYLAKGGASSNIADYIDGVKLDRENQTDVNVRSLLNSDTNFNKQYNRDVKQTGAQLGAINENTKYSANILQDTIAAEANSRGGVVYASTGKLVHYQPRGTDTVPAMLTPGEFVVNAKASKENLGLLQAINSGSMSEGGVVYARTGGEISPELRETLQKEAKRLEAPYAALVNMIMSRQFTEQEILNASSLQELHMQKQKEFAERQMEKQAQREKDRLFQLLGGGAIAQRLLGIEPTQPAENATTFNLTNPADVEKAAGRAVAELQTYASSDDAKVRIANVMTRQLKRTSFKYGDPYGGVASVSGDRRGSTLTLPPAALANGVTSNVLDHEFVHVFQNATGKYGVPNSRNVQDTLRYYAAYMDRTGFAPDHIAPKQGGVGYYSVEDLMQKPYEILPQLMQLKNQDPSAFASIGGPDAVRDIMRSMGFDKGGIVYANQGMLVPYRPKGTDTVPAMLTPGEFVVNRESAQANISLLRSINRSRGGGVKYLADGTDSGSGGFNILQIIQSFKDFGGIIPQVTSALSQLISGINNSSGGVNNTSTGAGGVNLDGLNSFTTQLSAAIQQLAAINIPSTINLQLAPATVNVNITGSEALAGMAQGIQNTISAQINSELNIWVKQNFDDTVGPIGN